MLLLEWIDAPRPVARYLLKKITMRVSAGLLNVSLLLPLCVGAADAPIELEQDMEGVQIEVSTGWIDSVAFARLRNRSPTAALCEAAFRNGPESRRRRARLESGEERTLTFQPGRQVLKLRIHLDCAPDDPPDSP